MKKILTIALLALFTTSAFADSDKTQTNDQANNPYTQLCIAALDSKQALRQKARELGISKSARDRLVCNELSLGEFADTHRRIDANTIATVQ